MPNILFTLRNLKESRAVFASQILYYSNPLAIQITPVALPGKPCPCPAPSAFPLADYR